MKFETARVCVLRRTLKPPADPIESNPFADPEFSYEVIAWPPGEVDGGMLPQVGDEISLPGYDEPFRVVERALHWPAPTAAEARRGELQVNLAVEGVPQDRTNPLNQRPFGRPGTEDGGDRRWLEAEVVGFETRDALKQATEERPRHRYTSIEFEVPGLGRLYYSVAWAWQVRALFGPQTMADLGDRSYADFGTLEMLLGETRRFEVEVGPNSWRGAERLAIHNVRPATSEETNR